MVNNAIVLRRQRGGNRSRAVIRTVNRPVPNKSSSMLPSKGSGRVTTQSTSRHYLSNATRYQSQQVLSSSQSVYPVGSQFLAGTQTFSGEQLSASAQAFIQNYDKYKISNVEIFVNLAQRSRQGQVDRSVPVDVWFYEDADCDSSTQTSWLRTRDRRNLGNVTLTSINPKMRLMSFEPTPTYVANATVSQSPTNIVPAKGKWLDALNLSQQMAGFRFFAACPQVDTQGQTYEFDIYMTTRYTVVMQQPI